jgi:hypothetical protein
VVGSPLHGVIYFSRWWLVRRLSWFLLHFLLAFKENLTIFGAVDGFTAVVHIVRGVHCVWASAVTVATIWSSAPLDVEGDL